MLKKIYIIKIKYNDKPFESTVSDFAYSSYLEALSMAYERQKAESDANICYVVDYVLVNDGNI